MPFSRGKYDSWLLRSLLLVVYVSFFMVQLFFITGQNSAAIISPSASFLSFHKTDEKKDGIDCNPGHIKKTKLTINKRFHHSPGAVILPVVADIPVQYTGSVCTITAKEYPLLSIILAESLRGPPSPAVKTA